MYGVIGECLTLTLKKVPRLRTKITKMVGAVEQFQAFDFFLMEKVLL